MRVKYSFESILILLNFLSNAMEGAKIFTYTSNSLFTHCFEVDWCFSNAEVCQAHCNEWEIDRSLLTIREHLGEGAFGLVMRADAVGLPDMPSTCSVAVKMQKGRIYQFRAVCVSF